MRLSRLPLAAAFVAGLLTTASAGAATLVLINTDAPGIGFNDPTPTAPVGGNAGTTLGEQRLIAYQRALDLWGSVLESEVPIRVRGSFARLNCTAGGGVLASAGALAIFADFPNAPLPGHWYGAALANALAGEDLDPTIDDIIANFNGAVGQPDCIAGPGFYYGLDNNAPTGAIDFLNTFMHEVAHGLGFQNFANETTGTTPFGLPDVYMANTFDLDLDQKWNVLTGPQIVASAINTGRVVWDGAVVNGNAAQVLGSFEGVRLVGNLNQDIEIGLAGFGVPATAETLNGDIVAAVDAGGVSTLDGCEPFVTDVVGKVALVSRGICGFVVKAANAQAAGAKALIIANNQPGGAIGLGGVDPAVTIATVSVSQVDGDAIRNALPGVAIEFFVDPARLAGTSEGLVRLFAPAAVQPGSSISHFDVSASPNLLMEPQITTTLRASQNLDLTPALMQDIGWDLESLKIGGCDTGVANALPDGELLSVDVQACIDAGSNRGQQVSCIQGVLNAAVADGLLSGADKGAISACAAQGVR